MVIGRECVVLCDDVMVTGCRMGAIRSCIKV
jgi:hypothetical protein